MIISAPSQVSAIYYDLSHQDNRIYIATHRWHLFLRHIQSLVQHLQEM